MNLLHIVDLTEGQIEVGWRRGSDIPRYYSPLPFEDPLSVEDRGELRWYLEQYLQFPYGAEEYRAGRVEHRMSEWGEALFSQVFPKAEADPDPRGFYQEAVREGLEQCELCVSSEDTDFLNIPWELIRDPAPGRGYLAPSLGGMYRQRSGQAIQAPLKISQHEPFRILLVIARPLGKKDIPLGTVSRPILDALRPLRARVQLEVLRPPTFEALVKRLADRPGFYHLVHFDGHGVFAPSGGGAAMAYGARLGQGHLVFEKDDGTEDIVNSEDLGQALATCKVPLFVLNACQSAEEGKADAYSSVAAQLVAVGAKGVVAMSYSVYADAASFFMERFYEKLVGGASLAASVAAGRKRLHATPGRLSVVGSLELRDWMVPTLYQQEQGYVPIPQADAVTIAEGDTDEAVQMQKAEEACPAGRFGFIGRDYDILRIERALRDDQSPWVLLSGMGGIGKTELAFGFARWYAETGGCPGGVFAASFKEKADFGLVIGSIVGYGTDFSRLSSEAQWEYLIEYLRERPCLLVWDNFETVVGYPQSAEPLATEEEQETLSKFVKALRGGKSRVLITTRKQNEDWLGIAPELIELGGLTQRDAGLLAREILTTVGRKPEEFRDDPQYSELIRLLRGHPRSLEVVLPHLRSRSPKELIEAIQHRVDDLGESLEDASLTYAFHQLSEKAQRHLPFLGVFVSLVGAVVLGHFVTSAEERQEAYVDVMGESMDAKAWEDVLDEAAGCGLVRSLGSRVYQLHPTLPPFLRSQLVGMVEEEGLRRLNREFLSYYAGNAASGFESVREGKRASVSTVAREEGNFLRALRLAEMEKEWAAAQYIVQLLGEFYGVRGRADEWIALRTRVLREVGRDAPPTSERDRADLWLHLVGGEAQSALEANRLAAAEADYRRGLDFLVSLKDAEVEPQFAVGYHQLGIIEQRRNRLDEAEDWYRKALEIRERLGLERDATSDYHQLGILAEKRAQFDAAEEWYRKALEIRERLGLERDAASDYHQLGIIAQERNQLDEAEGWCRKALEIYDRLGLEGDAADEYHQLGTIAEDRKQSDEAEGWYRKALEIRERLGLEAEAATTYHGLGMIAHKRNRLGEAEGWYRKALEVYERLGLEPKAATAYHGLGVIAQQQQRFDDAEGWYRKALGVYERLEHPLLLVSTLAQLGLLRLDQERLCEAVSHVGEALAIASRYEQSDRSYILVVLGHLMHQMGESEFTAAWTEAFEGQEPPLDAIREVLKRQDDDDG